MRTFYYAFSPKHILLKIYFSQDTQYTKMHMRAHTIYVYIHRKQFLNSEKMREKRFESRKISEHLGIEDVKQILLIYFFNSIRFIYRKKINHLA